MSLYQLIPNIATSTSPAWAVNGKKTILVWKGEATDTQLYWSTSSTLTPDTKTNKYDWPPQQKVGFATTDGPALAVLKGVVYLACKGATDQKIYLLTQKADGSWNIPSKPLSDFETSAAPTLAVTRGALYLAWKGKSDTNIWWSILEEGKDWTKQAAVTDNAKTSDSPSLASDGTGAMYLAFKGASDQRIWWTKNADGKTWSREQQGPGGAISAPALVVDGHATKWLAWSSQQKIGILPTPEGGFIFPTLTYCQLLDEAKNQWGPSAARADCGTSAKPALLSTSNDGSGVMVAGAGPSQNDIHQVFYSPLLLPAQTISFNMLQIIVRMMRTGHASFKDGSDTVYANIGVKVKGKPAVLKTVFAGEMTGGTYGQNLVSGAIRIEDTDTVYFSYGAINSSSGASQATQLLEKAASTVLSAVERADEAAIEKLTGVPLSQLTPQEAGALVGAQLGNLILPGFGAVIGALAGLFASSLIGFVFPDCDGPVAMGLYVFTAGQIRNALAAGHGVYDQTDDNPGTNSASGCGDNSDYQIVWNVQND